MSNLVQAIARLFQGGGEDQNIAPVSNVGVDPTGTGVVQQLAQQLGNQNLGSPQVPGGGLIDPSGLPSFQGAPAGAQSLGVGGPQRPNIGLGPDSVQTAGQALTSPPPEADDGPGFIRKLLTSPEFIDLIGVSAIGLIGNKRTRGAEAQQFLSQRREGRSLKFQQGRQTRADEREERRVATTERADVRAEERLGIEKTQAVTTAKVSALQITKLERDLAEQSADVAIESAQGIILPFLAGLTAEQLDTAVLEDVLPTIDPVIAGKARLAFELARQEASDRLVQEDRDRVELLRLRQAQGGLMTPDDKEFLGLPPGEDIGGFVDFPIHPELLAIDPGSPKSILMRKEDVFDATMAQIQALNNVRATTAQIKKANAEGKVDAAKIFTEANNIWRTVFQAEQINDPENALMKANAARDEVIRESLLLSDPEGVAMTPTALLATVQGIADQMQAAGEGVGDVPNFVQQHIQSGLFTDEDGLLLMELATAELERRESTPPPAVIEEKGFFQRDIPEREVDLSFKKFLERAARGLAGVD